MKRILNKKEAETYVGGRDNLRLLIDAKLVRAIPGKAQARDFDLRDLDAAIDTVKLAGWEALAK